MNQLTDEEMAALIEQIELSFEAEIEDLAIQLREARLRIQDLEAVIAQGDA